MKKQTIWIICLLAVVLLAIPVAVFAKLSRSQPQPEAAAEESAGAVPTAEEPASETPLAGKESESGSAVTEEASPEPSLPPLPDVGRITGRGGTAEASGSSGGTGGSSGGGSTEASGTEEVWVLSDVPVIGGEESVITYVQSENGSASGEASSQTENGGTASSAAGSSAAAGDETQPVGSDAPAVETGSTGAYPGADHELDNSHLRENETPLA